MIDSKGCSFDASREILRVSKRNKEMLWGKNTRGLYRLEGSVQTGGATVRHGSNGIRKENGQGKQPLHRGTQSKRRGTWGIHNGTWRIRSGTRAQGDALGYVRKSGQTRVVQPVQDVHREAQRKETKSILRSCTAKGAATPKRVSFALDLISGGVLSNCAHKGGEIEPRQLAKCRTLRRTPVGGHPGGGCRAPRGRGRRGGRGLLPNVGEGFDVNLPVGRNNSNPSQRNEIKALKRQVGTLTDGTTHPTAKEGSDRSKDTQTHFANPFGPLDTSIENVDDYTEAFYQLIVRVDLNESEAQMVARQEYQGGSKVGQPFQNIPRPALHLLASSNKSGSFGVGIPTKGVKPVGPSQNQPYIGPSGSRNPSQSGGFKCFKCGELGHKSVECRKASGNQNKDLLMEERWTVEQSCEDDIPIYDQPFNEEISGDIEEEEDLALMFKKTLLAP
ncbi:hypothetical protein Acr_27g0000510 [Actinidia rufa]|uniref:CCHC-type domain-containing protein n=1 Tax=Actinidia rufa TaxID=165716 RepID=A0A7J0H5G6_9ERIC|nr:hypothetical protein Acr_27g0000510 [Actinidia rufa]